MDTQHFWLLVRSLDVQIYPLPAHRCHAPNGSIVSGPGRCVFLETIGDALVWSCPLCRHTQTFSCSAMLRNNAQEPSGETVAQGGAQPMLMQLDAWIRFTNSSFTRDNIAALIDGL